MFLISPWCRIRPHAQANGHVGIAAQRAFFHLDVGDAQLDEGALERFEIADRLFRRADIRLADAFHQRYAGAVEVDQRIRRPGDPAVTRARVGGLAGIFFKMDAREAARLLRAVLQQ